VNPNIPLPSQTDDFKELAEGLNAATSEQRLNWMRGLSGKELACTYELAHGGSSLGLAHFHAGPGEVVIHHGQNSLLAFNAFQKRVVDNGGVLQGYNHQSMAWITGPGHFTLSQDEGEVLFDYTQEPVHAFDAFPPLKKNTSGLSALVYGNMIDRVRRVSEHCVIGAAFKGGKAMNAWFMLLREGEASTLN
jgi:hypothetical protein